MKIKKIFNPKIIPVLISIAFFFNTTLLYSYPVSRNLLRVPIQKATYTQMLTLQHMAGEAGDPNFFEDGDFKPFYGLTCITKINKGTGISNALAEIQERLRYEIADVLKGEGIIKDDSELNRYCRFLSPDSFHMTVRDIDPSDEYNPERKPFVGVVEPQFNQRLTQVSRAFQRMEAQGPISAHIKGVKFKDVSKLVNQQSVVIGAYVEFVQGGREQIIKIGDMIQQQTGADVRPFPGHITLAYLLKHPGGKAFAKIEEILNRYADISISDFLIDTVDFTYFASMDNFVTVLSKDFKSGAVSFVNTDYRQLTGDISGGFNIGHSEVEKSI